MLYIIKNNVLEICLYGGDIMKKYESPKIELKCKDASINISKNITNVILTWSADPPC